MLDAPILACELRGVDRYFNGLLAARIGKAKAVTATARKIAILFYRAMRFGMRYEDPGADQYEQRYRERVVKQLQRRAAHFGFSLQPVEMGVS